MTCFSVLIVTLPLLKNPQSLQAYVRPPRVRTAGRKRKNLQSLDDPLKNSQDMPKIGSQKRLRLEDPRQKYKVPPKVGSLKYRRQELKKSMRFKYVYATYILLCNKTSLQQISIQR